jgi:hypothetical protein
MSYNQGICRCQWPSGLKCGSEADRLMGLWIRIPSGAWMSLSLSFECCVLLGRVLSGEMITLPEDS